MGAIMLREHEIQVRVRYEEADPMGFLHHARYFVYFEMGRTEMLRASGGCYRQMEAEGILIVVAKAECRYRKPARYDDVLTIRTIVDRVTSAKIEHRYEVLCEGQCLAEGRTTLAVIDREGRICRVPEWMHIPDQSAE